MGSGDENYIKWGEVKCGNNLHSASKKSQLVCIVVSIILCFMSNPKEYD